MNKYYIPDKEYVVKIFECSESEMLMNDMNITKMLILKYPKKKLSVRNIKGYSEWRKSKKDNWNPATFARSAQIYEFEDDTSALLYSEVI